MIGKYFERIKTLDYLIRIKATGPPVQLAKRLQISESTLFEYISFMKRNGAPFAEAGDYNGKITKNADGTTTEIRLSSVAEWDPQTLTFSRYRIVSKIVTTIINSRWDLSTNGL